MNEYADLIRRLKKQKRKIKDLSELISKVSLHAHRMALLREIVNLLEVNEGVINFEWLDSPEQRKESKVKGKRIIGQFRYQLESPRRVLTVYKKS